MNTPDLILHILASAHELSMGQILDHPLATTHKLSREDTQRALRDLIGDDHVRQHPPDDERYCWRYSLANRAALTPALIEVTP